MVVVGRHAQHQPVLDVERYLARVAVLPDQRVQRVGVGHPPVNYQRFTLLLKTTLFTIVLVLGTHLSSPEVHFAVHSSAIHSSVVFGHPLASKQRVSKLATPGTI